MTSDVTLMPNLSALLIVGFVFFIIVATTVVVTVVPFWQICKKAGLPPQLSLLMLIPVANVILPFYVAFTDWPALRQTSDRPPGKKTPGSARNTV